MAERTRRAADGVLIALLAQGTPVREAAERAHVSPSTVTRRLRAGEFRAQIEQARAELWDAALGKASANVTRAVDTLVGLLDGDTPPAVKLGSAKALLDLMSQHIEQAQLEARLAVLEARLVEQGADGTERIRVV